jgi:hypothetical protein
MWIDTQDYRRAMTHLEQGAVIRIAKADIENGGNPGIVECDGKLVRFYPSTFRALLRDGQLEVASEFIDSAGKLVIDYRKRGCDGDTTAKT